MYRLRLLVAGALILLACAHMAFAQTAAPQNDPLYMRVMASTWPPEAAILIGNARKHSAYELYVTNFGKTPLKIVALDVQGKKDDEVVMTQSATGKQLAAMFMLGSGGDPTKPNNPILQPGQNAALFIFPDFAVGHAHPDTFHPPLRLAKHGQRNATGANNTTAVANKLHGPPGRASP